MTTVTCELRRESWTYVSVGKPKISICVSELQLFYNIGESNRIWVSVSDVPIRGWDKWESDSGFIIPKTGKGKGTEIPVYTDFCRFLRRCSNRKKPYHVWLKFDKEI